MYLLARAKENRSVDVNYEKCKRHNKQLNGDKTNIYGIRIRMRKCFSEHIINYVSMIASTSKKQTIHSHYLTMLTIEMQHIKTDLTIMSN